MISSTDLVKFLDDSELNLLKFNATQSLLRLGGISFFCIALGLTISSTRLCAEERESISIGDLFSQQSIEEEKNSEKPVQLPLTIIEVKEFEKEGDPVKLLFDSIEEKKFEEALRYSNLLSAHYRKSSEEYEDVLWSRAQIFEATGQQTPLINLVTSYVSNDAYKKHKAWFLIRAAREAVRQGKTSDAALLWEEASSYRSELSPEIAIEGAEILLGELKGKATRRLLGKADFVDTSFARKSQMILLHSLLIEDDLQVEVPEEMKLTSKPNASFNLSRAALLEKRQQLEKARQGYEELMEAKYLLAPAEVDFLKSRLRVEGEKTALFESML